MISNLTFNQRLFIGFLIPLTLVLVNSLMAFFQIQRYHQMMAYEIVSLQESDSIKDDLGKMLETSDKMASTAKISILLVCTVSIVLTVLVVFLVVKSIQAKGGG
jgi:CHASE3 domain sensor protein